MNAASLLSSVPEPGRPAIIQSTSRHEPYTFTQLDDVSSRIAQGFYDSGLRENDRVVVLAPVSVNLYASLIALLKLGSTTIFLDPQTRFQQLDRTLAAMEANAVICTPRARWLRFLLPGLSKIPRLFLSRGGDARSLDHFAKYSAPRSSIAPVSGAAPALITFTGGSTDPLGSRGVIRTHGLLVAQHMALARALPTLSSDIDMPGFPVVTLHNLASGITSVLPDFPFRRPDAVRPEKILRQIDMHRITTASGPPAYWMSIAAYCVRNNLSVPLRRIVTGGAPVSPLLIQHLQRIAPRAEIVNVYGSTEAEPVAWICGDEFVEGMKDSKKPGSGIPLGRPVPEILVRIQAPNGIECNPGEVGEICVIGEHVARTYFANHAAASKNKHLDEDGRLWHQMGDLGYKDEAGRLWLVGHANTVVRRAGQMMYTVQVETLAATMPYIRCAALIGVEDTQLGERSILIVEFAAHISRPGDWRSQLQSLCAQHGWILDEVHSIRRMPVEARHNSRIDYKELKAGMLRR